MLKYSLFEVRVAGFIFNNKKELLLLKNDEGTWGILGGHLEEGEQIEETLHREAHEETSLALQKIIYFGTRNIGASFVVGFSCKVKEGKIKLQVEEVQDYKWVRLNELKKFKLTFKELPAEAAKAFHVMFD